MLCKITVFSKYIILLCIIFVLPIFYAKESPWSQLVFMEYRREKGVLCLALLVTILCSKPNLHSPKADRLPPPPPRPQKNHLPFTAFPVIISCLCSIIVSVSYALVFFRRLNTRGTFISLSWPFIILYFSILHRIQAGNT